MPTPIRVKITEIKRIQILEKKTKDQEAVIEKLKETVKDLKLKGRTSKVVIEWLCSQVKDLGEAMRELQEDYYNPRRKTRRRRQ